MASHFIKTSPDTVIHVRLINEASVSNKAPLLVFLHYWGGSSSTWHKLTSPTSEWSLGSKYPSVSLDFRGWGQSTGPEQGDATAKDYAITPNAADIVSVLEHLKANAATAGLVQNGIVLVGHSMGGKVALAALSKVSNGILGLIKGLVLVAPAPPTPLVLPPEMSKEQQRAYDTAESVRWTVANVLSTPLAEDEVSAIVRDSLAGSRLATEGWLVHGMQENIVAALDEVSSRPGARTGHIKVSVLAGELDVVEQKDRVRSEVVETLAARGFPVTFTVVEGVKHLIPLEKPEAVSRAVEELLAN
jgi:pimeloyl-ACP methyl ester carboxylesterase